MRGFWRCEGCPHLALVAFLALSGTAVAKKVKLDKPARDARGDATYFASDEMGLASLELADLTPDDFMVEVSRFLRKTHVKDLKKYRNAFLDAATLARQQDATDRLAARCLKFGFVPEP